MLRYCRDCPEEKRKLLLSELAAQKEKDGPSRSTRSQNTTKHSNCIVYYDADLTISTAGRI